MGKDLCSLIRCRCPQPHLILPRLQCINSSVNRIIIIINNFNKFQSSQLSRLSPSRQSSCRLLCQWIVSVDVRTPPHATIAAKTSQLLSLTQHRAKLTFLQCSSAWWDAFVDVVWFHTALTHVKARPTHVSWYQITIANFYDSQLKFLIRSKLRSVDGKFWILNSRQIGG